MVKQKNIPALRFQEFKDQWLPKKMGNITNRISNPVSVNLNEQYQQIGIRSHGKGIFHKEFVDGKSLGNKRIFWIIEDALIVNIVFAWEHAVARTTKNEVGMVASHRFPMYVAIPNITDIDYLIHFFLTKKGKNLLELASPGGAGRNKTLGQKEFENLNFLIPSYPEQTKIALFLTAVNDKLQQLKKKKALLEQYKKGVMQQIFSQELRFKDDKGINYPDWETKKLGEISEIKKGTQLNVSELSESGSYPALNGGIYPSGYTDKWNTESNTISISEGGNSCGYVNYNNERFWSGGHCYSLININYKIKTKYLYQYLKFYEPSIMRLRVGSGLPNIQKKGLNDFQIQIPSLEEQTKIASFLSSIDDKINAVNKQIEKIQFWKNGLLQKMFV